MNRIFFRFFMLVMLSITAATFVIYFAMSRLFGDPLEDIARRQASAQIFLVEQYVDAAPADEWLARLNRVREVSDTRYDLIPITRARSFLPATSLGALDRGEVVLDVDGKSFYRRVDLKGERYIGSEDEVLHVQDLPIDVSLALQMEAVRYVIVALALLVPIALWSRSHWQGLQSLSRVADEFGAGKLSARAHMRPSASIYPLAERIDHMADRIEELLVSQKNLLHSVSHELRTPIARLEFALELLGDKTDDPALRKRIAAMEGDLAELNSLVNELLGMARLDSGQAPQREAVDVAALLRSVEASLPPGEPRPAIDCAFDVGTIEADSRLLGRALSNLLRNAQKYAGARIEVTARRDGGRVTIAVEDDGPGIPAEERERIFEPFYRLDRSRDRATGGFGLGLSIARKAVLLHGGSLHVEESALGGAKLVVVLPQR
ncbi:ATP-binding protein [Massilia sp. Leaf139]|uniref:ATP-binding protein n=1 Tax=Massilia sp. Leaf139 TaxID=1736272 RepID=UPI0006F3E3F1|nr:ATP-binding protein [Massilia sp. Leaf139]KQQ86747.1 sensor protein RstB [Massilia sp. Leaf139]